MLPEVDRETVSEGSETESRETDGGERVELSELGMGDVELSGARPAHVTLGKLAVYFVDSGRRVASLRRERERVEFVAAFTVAGDDGTVVLLVRSGESSDDGGRAYYVTEESELAGLVERLCGRHGFEATTLASSWLRGEVASRFVPE